MPTDDAATFPPPPDMPRDGESASLPADLPLPPASADLQNADAVIGYFDRAAAANLACPIRRGSVIDLAAPGRVLMTGDLHDHGLNLQRILRLADLDKSPTRHVILHELIHGWQRVSGRDFSVRTLARAAALSLQYPNRVHVLLGNHELAQMSGEEILKQGACVVHAFNRGLEYLFADDVDRVRPAMHRYIRSLALAVRCPNGVMCCHSLPSPRRLEGFDATILERVPTDADLADGGPAHDMVWGRSHTDALAQTLGQRWQVRWFVMGHQAADMGHEREGERLLVLASDHDHGVALPIDLSQAYSMDDLVDALIPLAAVRV